MLAAPKFSIIVPVYNVEQYLSRCIESILCQTFLDFELLLIDDGSLDSSGVICDGFARKDSRVVVFHKENGGVSKARNLGLGSATGEWVLFVDSDDWIDKDALCFFSMAMKEEFDLLQFSYVKIHDDLVEPFLLNIEGLFEDILSYENSGNYHLGICGYVIKRSVIVDRKIYFTENVKYAEDQEFILKCLFSSKRIFCVKQSFYNYRMRINSAMHLKPTFDKVSGYIVVVTNLLVFMNADEIEVPSFYIKQLRMLIKSIFGIAIQLDVNLFFISLKISRLLKPIHHMYRYLFNKIFSRYYCFDIYLFVLMSIFFLKIRTVTLLRTK